MSKYCPYILALFFFFTALGQKNQDKMSENGLLFLTKTYHNQSNWDAIISQENNINSLDTKNPELLFNLGKAFYFTSNYEKAVRYLQKSNAIRFDENTAILLYYSLYDQGYIQEANWLKTKMNVNSIALIEKDFPAKTIESVTLESGIKLLNEKNLGNNLYYGMGLVDANISKIVKLNAAYSHINQELETIKYAQNEVFVSFPTTFKNGFIVNPSAHAVFTTSNYTGPIIIQPPFPFPPVIPFTTSTKTNLLYLQMGLSKRFQNLTIKPSFGVHFSNVNETLTDNTTIKTTSKTYQYGGALFYNLAINKSCKLVLNPNYYYLYQSDKKGQSINFNLFCYLKKWQFLTSYLSKGNLLFAGNEGLYYYNLLQDIKSRYGFSAGRTIFKNTLVLLTYQKEFQKNQFNISNTYDSIFLTLTFKL
ncbi:MAG: hypothetical protein H7250_08880 [Flavobacterium sp.]|nr:hypothetical protein [Flavobacterium sp.]